MVSSDDAIPEAALNVVDAFVSKNEAPSRLLPVITRICGENPSGFQKPESQPEHGCVRSRRDGEDAVPCLLQNSIGGHGLVSGNQRSDPHDRFTVLLPGHVHFRPDHMDSAFSVPNGLFASG